MSQDGHTNEEWDRLLAMLPSVLEDVGEGATLTNLMYALAARTTAYDSSAVRQVVHGHRKHLGFEWDYGGQNPKLRRCADK